MFTGCVDYAEDELRITTYKGEVIRVSFASIAQVYFCRYDDPAQDEEFFILMGETQFWLIGYFVENSGSIDLLRVSHPEIPWKVVSVYRMPWKLRKPGLFGIRWFPIAGLGVFPLSDLPPHSIVGEWQ